MLSRMRALSLRRLPSALPTLPRCAACTVAEQRPVRVRDRVTRLTLPRAGRLHVAAEQRQVVGGVRAPLAAHDMALRVLLEQRQHRRALAHLRLAHARRLELRHHALVPTRAQGAGGLLRGNRMRQGDGR